MICFPCEKKLLLPDGTQRISLQRRRKLGQWVKIAQAASPAIHGCRRLS